MRLPLLLALAVPPVAASVGCGGKARRESAEMEGRYTLGEPGDGWRRMMAGGADKAWFNEGLSATIYADSNCLSRFEDAPLEDLAIHLVAGIADAEAPLREERMTLDGREALLRVYPGSLDGVAVQLGILVLKKDSCTYDLIYVAPPSRFEDGWSDFVGVISGFQARATLIP